MKITQRIINLLNKIFLTFISIFYSSIAFANDAIVATETQSADASNPQIVEFIPEEATAANSEYKITISDIDYIYTTIDADSVKTIVEDLQTKANTNAYITCTEDDTKIVCKANDSGATFTYSSEVSIDSTKPEFSSIEISGGIKNNGKYYAKKGDNIKITLKLNPKDTWKSGNNAKFSIGGTTDLETENFTFSTENKAIRNKTYIIFAGQNGEFSFTELAFYDQYDNEITGFTAPYSPTQNIIVDTTSPTITFTDDVSATPVQSDDVIITVTDENEDSSSYKYVLLANNTCDDSVDFSSSTDFTSGDTITYSTEDNNTKFLCVEAKDIVGNVSYLSSTNALNIDTTKPDQPSLPADLEDSSDTGDVNTDNITNDTTPTFNVVCTEDDSTLILYDGSTKIGEVTCTAVGDKTITASVLSEGNHSIVYTEKDIAGNESISSSTLVIEIDVTAPELQSFSSSTANDTYGPNQYITIIAQYDSTIGNGSSVNITLNNGAVVVLDTIVGTKITGIYTVGATGSSEDTNDLNVVNITSQNAFDLYGNALTTTTLGTSNIENTSDIKIDTTAPEIATGTDVVISSNNANTGSNIESKAKAGDEITVKFTTNEEVQDFPIVKIAEKTATVTNPSGDKKTFEAKYTVVNSDTNGEASIDIVFTDIVGNEVSSHVVATTGSPLSKVEIDTVNSVASVQKIYSNSTDIAKAKAGDEITLEFTTNEEVQDFPTVKIAEKTATVTNPSGDNTTFLAKYIVEDTDINGKAKIEIGQFDIAGNETSLIEISSVSDSSEVVIDTIKPVLAEVTKIVTPTKDTTPSYTFSTDEEGSITYSGGCSSGLINAVVGNNQITLNTLSENTYSTCGIYVKDATGNISDILNISIFIIDLTPPSIVINSGESYVRQDSVYTDTGAVCTDAIGSCTVSTKNNIDINTIGEYSIVYTATDIAGNSSTASRLVRVISKGTGGQNVLTSTHSGGGGGGSSFSSSGSSVSPISCRPIISNIFPAKNTEFVNAEKITFTVSAKLKQSTLKVSVNNSLLESDAILITENKDKSYSVIVNIKDEKLKDKKLKYGNNNIILFAESVNSSYYNPCKIELSYNLKKVTQSEEIEEIEEKNIYLDTTDKYILELTKRGIINGTKTEKGVMFYPKKSLNRAEAVKIVINGFYPKYKNKKENLKFPDIEKDAWFKKFVISAVENKIITGYDDGEFKAGNSLSNIEALVIISRSAKVDISKYILDDKYTNIKKDAWYRPYLAWALSENLISLTDKNIYKVDAEITRAEFIKLNYLYLQK